MSYLHFTFYGVLDLCGDTIRLLRVQSICALPVSYQQIHSHFQHLPLPPFQSLSADVLRTLLIILVSFGDH
jgi:hypothetical protein